MHLRARDESGFGMLELLMAMVMLNVGILAIVGAFSSGNASLARANRISTAGALANKQTEAYRGPEDLAAHSARGRRTKRTEAMFGPLGHAERYLQAGQPAFRDPLGARLEVSADCFPLEYLQ